jgi:hypothetical protein
MRSQLAAPITFAILFSLNAAAQVSLSPPQGPVSTAPSPQRQQPQGGGRQPLTPPIGQVPQTQPQVLAPTGVLMGYVFWDPSAIPYSANSSPCPFQMRVNQGTPPAGGAVGFEQFTPVGTYKNNFSSLGNVGKYVVCQYAADHLPEGKDLQVQIGPSKGAFQIPVTFTIPPTANEPNSPIRINGGKCNQLPPAVPSLSNLESPWWSCGDHAYNVNFLMERPRAIPGLTQIPATITPLQSQPLLPASKSTNGMINPGPQQPTLIPNSSTGAGNPGPIQKPNE